MPHIRNSITALLALMFVLPLLAACGPGGTEAELPTAQVATAQPGAAVVTPANPTTVPAPPNTDAPPTSEPPPSTAPDVAVENPLRTQATQFGVVEHLYYTDRERVLTLTKAAGFTWARQQIQWKDIEGPEPKNYAWAELDNIVNDANANGVKLLISIVQAPTFYNETNGLPQNPADMGDFVAAMMEHYGNKIAAVEIWNEQNLATENGGRVTVDDAGRYVEILAESYKRIKAITPDVFVVAGGPSSTAVNDESIAVSDENYYRAMYSYKDGMIKDYFDVQAVHPGGAANPPDTLFPENPSFIEGCVPAPDRCWNNDPTHYFRHLENIRRFMVEEGVGDHQMWVTEFGWATPNDTPGYEFGNFVSLDQQAEYIVSAMQRMNEEYKDEQGQPWVGVAFLWNMNFAVLKAAEGLPDDEQGSFGILGGDWSPRPSFLAVQSYLAQVKQERGE